MIELIINGLAYSGWERIDVQIGMEQIAGTFDLTLIDRWPELSTPRPIKPGQRCVLKLQDDVVISGYVDEVECELGSDSHTITVRGRDATGDLVDCSVLDTRQWNARTLLQIAVDVCKPFAIPVKSSVPLKPLSASVQDGETAHELLDRLAKQAGVLLMSDGRGGLLIAAPGTAVVNTVLADGHAGTLLRAHTTASWCERFSLYVLKSQRPASDEDDGETAAHVSASVRDVEIDRYRPLVVIADDHGASPAKHVAWEAHVRSGRGTRASVTVAGWTHGGGLWQPNSQVRLASAILQTDDLLMISSVRFGLDSDQGSVTELELADPRAFDVAAGLHASRIGSKAKSKSGLLKTSSDKKKHRHSADEGDE